jgi:hypothetical protein
MPNRKRHTTEEVEIVTIFGTTSGRRRKPLRKSSRREELRGEIVTLRHLPSGREGSIEIPKGHYSKKEMQRLREDAKVRFLEMLEDS